MPVINLNSKKLSQQNQIIKSVDPSVAGQSMVFVFDLYI